MVRVVSKQREWKRACLSVGWLVLIGCGGGPPERGADLGGNVEWLVDEAGTLSLDQVISAPLRAQFRPAAAAPKWPRFPKATYWFRVKLDLAELGLYQGDWVIQL